MALVHLLSCVVHERLIAVLDPNALQHLPALVFLAPVVATLIGALHLNGYTLPLRAAHEIFSLAGSGYCYLQALIVPSVMYREPVVCFAHSKNCSRNLRVFDRPWKVHYVQGMYSSTCPVIKPKASGIRMPMVPRIAWNAVSCERSTRKTSFNERFSTSNHVACSLFWLVDSGLTSSPAFLQRKFFLNSPVSDCVLFRNHYIRLHVFASMWGVFQYGSNREYGKHPLILFTCFSRLYTSSLFLQTLLIYASAITKLCNKTSAHFERYVSGVFAIQ